MSDDTGSMVERARRAAHAHSPEAAGLWRKVLEAQPAHAEALLAVGIDELNAGDAAHALEWLRRAHQAAPEDPSPLLAIAGAQRALGESGRELEAIMAALERDPYHLRALLEKGLFHERQGESRIAGSTFGNALTVAGPEPNWPPALRTLLAHAQDVHRTLTERMFQQLAAEADTASAALPEAVRERWREAASIMAGRSRPYHAVCNQLHIPRLPAIPFFERERFDWIDQLEAATPAITEEWRRIWTRDNVEFGPYVRYAPGTPVNQWAQLNHSRRWSSYFLWQDGAPVAAHQASCPETTAAIARCGLIDIPGQTPNAMFSVLAPRTHIPPHHGETNARTLVHLPLIVPPNCSYRVGFEWRQWEVGKALIFDDTLEHEARNDSDQIRVVLIFEIWNPLLAPEERELVRRLSASHRAFRA